MKLSLAPETAKIIDDCLKSGQFESPEAVVTAALQSFQNAHDKGDFASGEWNALLAKGEKSGNALRGEDVLAELRMLRESHP